jgi:hypothetical protein
MNGISGGGQRQMRWPWARIDGITDSDDGGDDNNGGGRQQMQPQKLEEEWDQPATMKRGQTLVSLGLTFVFSN